jgi:hypothetical protein
VCRIQVKHCGGGCCRDCEENREAVGLPHRELPPAVMSEEVLICKAVAHPSCRALLMMLEAALQHNHLHALLHVPDPTAAQTVCAHV